MHWLSFLSQRVQEQGLSRSSHSSFSPPAQAFPSLNAIQHSVYAQEHLCKSRKLSDNTGKISSRRRLTTSSIQIAAAEVNKSMSDCGCYCLLSKRLSLTTPKETGKGELPYTGSIFHPFNVWDFWASFSLRTPIPSIMEDKLQTPATPHTVVFMERPDHTAIMLSFKECAHFSSTERLFSSTRPSHLETLKWSCKQTDHV